MKLAYETKVGLFALIAILIIAYAIIRVGDRGAIKGRGYRVSVTISSAEGLTRKTPVEVAGIQVGYVESLDLVEGRRARAVLRLDQRVRLGADAEATVRTKGFLGETYVDLEPGDLKKGEISEGGEILVVNPYTDVGRIVSEAAGFLETLKRFSENNEENVQRILSGLAQFSEDLSTIFSSRKEEISETMDRLSNISRKIDDGRGTLGRLVNDEEIADNLNEAAKGVSTAVGGVSRFQMGFDYHLEYLGVTKDYKNYVGLNLKPRPDKYFRLEFVVDPQPSPDQTITTTTETTGGVTTTTVTDERVINRDDFRISAQLAKSFYDFTVRAGVIESRGGAGLDWEHGPLKVEFSAFDFRTTDGQRPHLKALGRVSLTRNIFIVSGLDDFISPEHNPDWFVGAGLALIDEDIKSLFSAATLSAARR
ncbi:MAG: MCE family protein [Deltaproteobacteria bacterium]|nr:MCE family protein [Deltaproteobacteria bacterium]